MLLFALVRGVLSIFHFVGEFEEGVFDVIEAVWWRFAVFGTANWGHDCGCRSIRADAIVVM